MLGAMGDGHLCLQLVVGNALRLIDFLGKMLGKAMYEGGWLAGWMAGGRAGGAQMRMLGLVLNG